MQTGLTPVITASTISASNGSTQAFTLSNAKNTSAIVAYTQPAPPAQNRLSHRYTQILVDTSSMTSAGLSALQSAAETRVGFDIDSALQAAGLSKNVVAGNSFNVTNPGQTFSSASFGNLTSVGIGNGQQADQMIKSDGGFKGFGVADSDTGGTLTTTISSAPAGPTSGLTNAGKSGSQTSTASTGSRPLHVFTYKACLRRRLEVRWQFFTSAEHYFNLFAVSIQQSQDSRAIDCVIYDIGGTWKRQ
ncbi:hypothetical protein LA080_005504 [Diaporthe eres]|nr:hypothetical protein LA080_005504 [Diaporthe eres]